MRIGVGRAFTGILAWCAGVVAAAAVGLLALSLIGTGLSGRALPPLSAAAPEVSVGTPSVAPTEGVPTDGPESTPPAASVVERVLTVSGGSVLARCAGGRAFLVSWSPDQGYRVEDVRRGPTEVATVKFQSERREYVLRVRCIAGVPQGTVGDDDSAGHH